MIPTRVDLLRSVLSQLEAIRDAVIVTSRSFDSDCQAVSPAHEISARNLAHYVALRQHELRDLQRDLSSLGLSSLGRLEAHTMATLDAVLWTLHDLLGLPWEGKGFEETADEFDLGDELLEAHAEDALGPTNEERLVRIMVTMPSEAADDPAIIRELVDKGMDLMRVNCAHDGPEQWERMLDHLRTAEKETGRRCRVAFDLAGPKLRTGAFPAGQGVTRWKPDRDDLGRVTSLAKIAFVRELTPDNSEGVRIVVPGDLLDHAQLDDSIRLVDARGRKRELRVIGLDGNTIYCESDRTAYLIGGTALRLYRGDELIHSSQVEELPSRETALELSIGDCLHVVPENQPDDPTYPAEADNECDDPTVSCSLPAVFDGAKVGERIFFDDGKIGGVIRFVRSKPPCRLEVEITHAVRGRTKLRAEKGINLPDTELHISALTAKDRSDLEFIARHGDLVSLSFVRRPRDVDELIAELDRLNAPDIGIILKIENRRAVENFPRILLSAMRRAKLAVMIARGDLGIEIGFDRMAEIQEQLLWICEAAHVPVIWATQVLESLAKRGVPSRAEVTDAAMGSRAECVMLNKGPHILLAVQFLDNVLSRMETHQTKKVSLMRKLSMASRATET